jgi:hypothetical protein
MSKTKQISTPEWEIKDRTYFLTNQVSPLTYTLGTRHSRRYPLLHFDEKNGEQRELRYATNMNSPFVDEQKGEVTLGHVIFEEGMLFVPKQKQNLQKLLSLYHPRKGHVYAEFKPEVVATDEIEEINFEIDALLAAKQMEIDQAESVLRVEKGSAVSTMSSKGFLAIANDENVGLRNVGIKAVEQGIIKISQDQRTFHWGTNDRKLMTVPFDEQPYSALAAWFKTDEGVDVFKTINKKLQ